VGERTQCEIIFTLPNDIGQLVVLYTGSER
jgi:hypothetical protein